MAVEESPFSEKPLEFDFKGKEYRYKFPTIDTVENAMKLGSELGMNQDGQSWTQKAMGVENLREKWTAFCKAIIEDVDGLDLGALTFPEAEVIAGGFFMSAGLTTRISPKWLQGSTSTTEGKSKKA